MIDGDGVVCKSVRHVHEDGQALARQVLEATATDLGHVGVPVDRGDQRQAIRDGHVEPPQVLGEPLIERFQEGLRSLVDGSVPPDRVNQISAFVLELAAEALEVGVAGQ